MKKQKMRADRGSVQLLTRGKKLAVRFTYQGQQYKRSIGLPANPWGKHQARAIIQQIERDLNYGEFDPTFTRYLPEKPTPETPKLSTLDLWQRFTDYRLEQGTSGQAITSRYKPIAANLSRFNRDIQTPQDARDFIDLLRTRQSGKIANQNLSLLKGFGTWVVSQGYWENNHFEAIPPLKAPKGKNIKPPFTREEIQAILATAKTDPVAYRYHGFILVLLTLGLRPSEAIGLRWKHIDLYRGEATICESLSRSPDGKTAGYARQRKTTKTGNARTLPLPSSVLTMLQGKFADAAPSPDDLVFTSTTGKAIDDRNFAQRIWRRVLDRAGVEYRKPYNCRHSLLSHLIEGGASLPQAAPVAGHANTRMVSETYGHMINRPQLPDF